jgi:hypothetical protein
MNDIFDKLLIPIIVGVITPILLTWLTPIITRGKIILDWKTIIFITVIVFLVVGGIISIQPPNKFTNAEWCVRPDGTTRVTGRLARSIFGSSAPGYPVQIKIYEAGREDPPFKAAVFAVTGINGEFTSEFASPAPSSGSIYVINTAYPYDTFFAKELWKIKDFKVGNPLSCPP